MSGKYHVREILPLLLGQTISEFCISLTDHHLILPFFQIAYSMPTITSKATNSSTLKSKRLERRNRNRLRQGVTLPSNAVQRRQGCKSQMKDNSLLDQCFAICNEMGYQEDPDVHIGSRNNCDGETSTT